LAYITPIGSSPEQVEYRLSGAHGCGRPEAADTQFSYHTDGRERPLVWTGAGLPEVGLTPGAVLDEDQFDTARALMAGVDPRTGERLVEPKLAVYEDAKVPLQPLIAAVHATAAERGVDPAAVFTSDKVRTMYTRAARSVDHDGAAAVLRADEAGKIADAAKIDVDTVWGRDTYAAAVANLTETTTQTATDGTTTEHIVPRRRVVGNMGYDISLTLPKSYSLLLAFADEDTATAVEGVYTRQVGTTFDWLEEQTAYGMRGHHGDGKSAETVKGSGFLGWTMVHRAARPVGDRVIGDPHWHVHTTIANMTHAQDGKWSTVAAGGRDLMRHAPAADHILKALIRRTLTDTYGVQFTRSQRTGGWEVAAIPDATLREFSKRGASIEAMLKDLGFDPEQATRRAEDLAAAQTRHDKTHSTAAPDATLRSLWQAEAREHGVDPDQLAADAFRRRPPADSADTAAGTGPGPKPDTGSGSRGGGEDAEEPDEATVLRDVVSTLLNPESGLTSSMRRFTRVDVLAAVADAMPTGARDVAEIETLTDKALTDAGIVPLAAPAASGSDAALKHNTLSRVTKAGAIGERHQLGAGHMANGDRYTTRDVVNAEKVILTAAVSAREGQGAVQVSPRTAAMARSVVEAGQGFALSTEQAAIVHRLVTSDRALDAVLGPPGTGKTTLMRAARAGWEADGHTVAGAATAAVAAQNLHTESGIGSKTVAQWVWSIKDSTAARRCVADNHTIDAEDGTRAVLDEAGQRRVDRAARHGGLSGVDVLVLDEANLTDDRDRAVLYTEAQRTGTKIVEVGDPQQLRGVGCGSLFGRVHELLDGAALTENRRQSSEDERATITAWRDGRYAAALTSWTDRGRMVATETGDQALTAMVSTWMGQRSGAPDPHAEMRGVVMLAATNESVDRLNQAAQAVRAATGELGDEQTYTGKGGRSVALREGDHVLLRLNDRRERMHEGPDVLNGYRGVIERIDPDTTAVHVAWQQQTDDGYRTERATLSPDYIAKGGVTLGYAMTAHKAEGLTVAADWQNTNGENQGGSVLVYAPGMDEPGLHVATTRHKDKMFLFAGREQVETVNDTYEKGIPATEEQRDGRVIAALAEQARQRPSNANDTPVHDDLGRTPQPDPAEKTQERGAVRSWWRRHTSPTPAETTVQAVARTAVRPNRSARTGTAVTERTTTTTIRHNDLVTRTTPDGLIPPPLVEPPPDPEHEEAAAARAAHTERGGRSEQRNTTAPVRVPDAEDTDAYLAAVTATEPDDAEAAAARGTARSASRSDARSRPAPEDSGNTARPRTPTPRRRPVALDPDAAWKELLGDRPPDTATAAGSERDAARDRAQVAKREAARREAERAEEARRDAARRDDVVRREDRGRGPRM